MSETKVPKPRWISEGLSALALHGASALKADVLASRLDVSRGGFYWHWRTVAAFHDDVLEAWEKRATDDVISQVDSGRGDPRAKLGNLADIVFATDGSLERQVRSWAAHHAPAAVAQERVDRARIAYVQHLVEAAGLPSHTAEVRARIMYLALVGHFSTQPSLALDSRELRQVIDALLTADVT